MVEKKRVKMAAVMVFVVVAGAIYAFRTSGGEMDAPTERPPFVSEAVGQGTDAVETTGEADAKMTEAPAEESSGVESERVFVHVCGEVNVPGVYELAGGARMNEAVEMAGGFTRKAARDGMNLALPVTDGQQVYVPSKKEAKASRQAVTGAGGKAADAEVAGDANGGRVNLNTATKEELMTLTGVGEAKADAILMYREENGGFGKVEDVMKITGIKEGVFNQIKDDITV